MKTNQMEILKLKKYSNRCKTLTDRVQEQNGRDKGKINDLSLSEQKKSPIIDRKRHVKQMSRKRRII